MIRLTYGEIADSGERRQDEFLTRISLAPADHPARLSPVLEDLVKNLDLCIREETQPNEVLKARLLDWSRTWNIDVEWVREKAFDMLIYCKETGALSYSTVGLPWSEPNAVHLAPPEGYPIYTPLSMKREEYMREVKGRILEGIARYPMLKRGINKSVIMNIAEQYCRKSERELKVETFGIRTEIEHLERDMDWTVRYQVEREEFREIAKTDDVGPETVDKAVTKMLKELGLKKRNKRGRPKNSKSGYTIRPRTPAS